MVNAGYSLRMVRRLLTPAAGAFTTSTDNFPDKLLAVFMADTEDHILMAPINTKSDMKRLDYNEVAPEGVKASGRVYGYVMQSDLSPILVDLVYLRVSQINNCA